MAEGVISSVLRWLRVGYPEGVPPKDYFPLLALLRRTLTEAEFDDVIAELDELSADPVRKSDIRAAIERVTAEPPREDEVRAVAARLAAVGWPLSGGVQRLVDEVDEPPRASGAERGPVERVLAWLREGYPDGVPSVDYAPILALLRRRLSDDEVRAVADALIAQQGADADQHASRVDAQVLMTKVLGELPSEADVARVEQRLAAVGWALV
ncbi:MAG: DUF3349 domain-containing protein [Microbacterium sp.]|uniref:DUF3349 domain-containing protein n=1 Tax=Microbacterium sp. TaxID=51671 RepID=UPI0039E5D425